MTHSKRFFKPLSLLAICLLLGKVSLAQSPATNQIPKDTALVKELSNYVVVLNHPVLVYNWFNAAGRNPIWKTQFSASDSVGYEHFVNMSRQYFQSYCSNDPSKDPSDCTDEKVSAMSGRGNMFGPGLYASTDPIATKDYGAGSDSWVVMQVRLHKGFRFLTSMWQVQNDKPISNEIKAELNGLGCSTTQSYSNWPQLASYPQTPSYPQGAATPIPLGTPGVMPTPGPQPQGTPVIAQYQIQLDTAEQLLNFLLTLNTENATASNSSNPTCRLNIRRILRDRLKIEGFYYSYNGTPFSECSKKLQDGTSATSLLDGNALRNGAFVIASDKKIRPNDVRVFNSQTVDDVQDRVQITSLFYRLDQEQDSGTSQSYISAAAFRTIKYYNTHGIPNYPGYQVILSPPMKGCYTTGPFVNVCGDWYPVYSPSAMTGSSIYQMPLPPPPDDYDPVSNSLPTKISATSPPRGMAMYTPTLRAGLFWNDLDGMSIDPNIGSWTKQNLFGCQDIPPFGEVPSVRHHRKYPVESQ